MSSIRALLNPILDKSKHDDSAVDSSEPEDSPRRLASVMQPRKKQKTCKDAAIFTPGPIRGECRYPPHEYQDELLAAQHKEFGVFPMGEIADYPRHIPYSSEKKSFLTKTCRESLEVFQYQFKSPGDEQTYSILWDYNIGLVRTTPLFKCTGYSKTTPAKMLNRNPGLREVCHSITGGALVAQGYWMPYEAAKAVAATFCWKIRYALTPIFGVDFPSMCLHPDSENFGDMTIDPAITKKCREEAEIYRQYENYSVSRSPSALPSPPTPDTPNHPRCMRTTRRKLFKLPPTSNYTSPYSSDSNSDDNHAFISLSPEPIRPNAWTPVNTPRSVPSFNRQTRPPRGILSNLPRETESQCIDYIAGRSETSSPAISPKTITRTLETDQGYDGDREEEVQSVSGASQNRNSRVSFLSDEKAAYLLLGLRLQKSPVEVERDSDLSFSSSKINKRKRAASA